MSPLSNAFTALIIERLFADAPGQTERVLRLCALFELAAGDLALLDDQEAILASLAAASTQLVHLRGTLQ